MNYVNSKYEDLFKKVLYFWNNNDGKDFNVKELRQTFNHYELARILFDYGFKMCNRIILPKFKNKIICLDNLFSKKEAEELIKISQYYDWVYLFKYLEDEQLMSFVSDFGDSANDIIALNMSSDEARIECFNKLKDFEAMATFISKLESEELKLKYLKKISPEYKYMVIASFKDEELKEKCLTTFVKNKGKIISNFSNDDKKLFYLKKHFSFLSNDDKVNIIVSLENKEKVLYALSFCDDSVKSDIIYRLCFDNEEIDERIIDTIKNRKELAKLLKFAPISDELRLKYIDKIDEKSRVEVIKLIDEKDLKFKAFKYISVDKNIFELIEHCESFPKYIDEYEYIIDLYAKKYGINKENLLHLVKNVSLSILRVIKNVNITKILNSSNAELQLIVKLFNKEGSKMNSSSMNDVANLLLQREFKINYPNIMGIFPTMLDNISNGDKNGLTKELNYISRVIDINNILVNNSWTLEQYIDLLLSKDEKAIEVLHSITTSFIISKRNEYLKENLQKTIEQCTDVKYEKNNLMKYIIVNYPVEAILLFFPQISKQNEQKYQSEYTIEELNLLKDIELLKKIITYKKNINGYNPIQKEVKANLNCFNSVFEKAIAHFSFGYFLDISSEKKEYHFREIDEEYLIEIMMNLDIDKMRKYLFNDSQLMNKLMKYCTQYKLIGWKNTFEGILKSTDIIMDALTVADFIQYFGLAYSSLQEKLERGELVNISLTALLDLASCYSAESKKYSNIFEADNFKYIVGNPGPNSATMLKEKRIEEAMHLIKKIRNRKYITVPPIDKNFTLENGKIINVVVGNFSNMMNLTYGERTGSCMRIGGLGQSLFDFCLKNDNGFHIRFVNPKNNRFVSRVSGFRNGNTVFLNQLRYPIDFYYANADIVEACKLVSDELIKLSQDSHMPIENVVISPFLSMHENKDKFELVDIDNPQVGMPRFYTDLELSAILLTTSNQNNELETFKPNANWVPKYPVQRDKKQILYYDECNAYVEHLRTLDQFLSGIKISDIDVEKRQNAVMGVFGEDWYVTLDKNGILKEFIMKNTNDKKRATFEMQEALMDLKEKIDKKAELSDSFMGKLG